MGFFSGGFEIIFFLMFLLFICFFIVNVVRGISIWNKNNHSPRLTVDAAAVTKRSHTSHSTNANHNMPSTTTTSYYVTFQFESGDRTEFKVSHYDYAMIVEGDKGKLTFQGTRFLSFERI